MSICYTNEIELLKKISSFPENSDNRRDYDILLHNYIKQKSYYILFYHKKTRRISLLLYDSKIQQYNICQWILPELPIISKFRLITYITTSNEIIYNGNTITNKTEWLENSIHDVKYIDLMDIIKNDSLCYVI